MPEISQKKVLEYCVNCNIPFAIYKNPGDSQITLLISEEVEVFCGDQLSDYIHNKGFIIVPFDARNEKSLFLSECFVIGGSTTNEVYESIKNIKVSHANDSDRGFCATYDSYNQQYHQIYSQIESGNLEKAILSRIKRVDGTGVECAVDVFYRLCSTYNGAYCFMYYTSFSGLWMGASPELLLKVENNRATTVSLAGTLSEGEHLQWRNKEVAEQQIVTDFVSEVLNKNDIRDIEVDGPHSVKAGKLFHLKTIYHFAVNGLREKLGDFIKDLHPTPAVCGLPKNEAMKVILEVEEHMRSYYSGFVGRIDNGNMDLFVNIRSMKFSEGGVDMFLGGGITIGSEPESEWNETELKASTLLDVIKEIKG